MRAVQCGFAYSNALLLHWSELEGRCDVTRDDIERARELSEKLVSALSGPQEDALCEAQDLRNRAYEHLRRAFDDIRSAARFVFRDQPSRLKRYPRLHALGRRKRASTPEQPAETATPVEQPAADESMTPALVSEPVQAASTAMVN
jgi:hypothetical protein